MNDGITITGTGYPDSCLQESYNYRDIAHLKMGYRGRGRALARPLYEV